MSDPILPTPAPEPAPRRRKISRKTWVGVAVASVLVLGGVGGAYAKGESDAKEYAKALDAWNDQKNDMLGAPSEANRLLWDFEDPTSKKSLALQKEACEDVETLRKSAAKNAEAFPAASDTLFKLLSSADRRAIKDSAAREKAVNAYAKAADTVMVQLHKDCVWNIRANSADRGDSGSKKVYDEAETLVIKKGQSDGAYYCPSSSDEDCLPHPAKLTRYAELLLKAAKLDKSYFLKQYFKPGLCEATSYGQLCGALKKNIASFYGTSAEYSKILKTLDPTSVRVEQEFDEMKKKDRKANKAFRAALFKARPELKSSPRVSESVFWREAFFDAVATASIEDLDKLRTAVLKER